MISAVMAVARIPGWDSVKWDSFHNWRESESMARISGFPSLRALEPVGEYLAVVLWKHNTTLG
jgi:hypothetical protein